MNKYNISIIHKEKDVEEYGVWYAASVRMRKSGRAILPQKDIQGGTSYGAFSTAIWNCSDEKEIAGDHPDADGLGSGVCLFLSGIH